MEILRLEPIAAPASIAASVEDIPSSRPRGPIGVGRLLCGRSAARRTATRRSSGPCPHSLDPDRRPAPASKSGSYMSFGDGRPSLPRAGAGGRCTRRGFVHRSACCGVAPASALEAREPDMLWNEMLASYELPPKRARRLRHRIGPEPGAPDITEAILEHAKRRNPARNGPLEWGREGARRARATKVGDQRRDRGPLRGASLCECGANVTFAPKAALACHRG